MRNVLRLIVPVIQSVTDGHYFIRHGNGPQFVFIPKIPPFCTYTLATAVLPWLEAPLEVLVGLTVDLLSLRSVEFRLRMKNDDLSALFTEAVLTYAVFARTGLRREISPAVFSRVQLKREYIQNQPPLSRPPN
jgi:hypothetical protein